MTKLYYYTGGIWGCQGVFVDGVLFFLCQKEKNQKKNRYLSCWLPGRELPMMSPHDSSQQKQQKRKPAFHPCTWVEAGLLLLLFF
ncbi:MAG: hypothetical protein J6K72_11075 [Clostridia bacterium]|nr:hypothetical protein [Clostridia bacterium]